MSKIGFYFLSLIVKLYKKYVDCIYIPKNVEFSLSRERTATPKPIIKLWIHTRKTKPYKVQFGRLIYGTDEHFEQLINL